MMTDDCKDYEEKLREIDQLKEIISIQEKTIKYAKEICDDLRKKLATSKYDGAKELAERLEETKFKQNNKYIVYAQNIDVILKEMEKWCNV